MPDAYEELVRRFKKKRSAAEGAAPVERPAPAPEAPFVPPEQAPGGEGIFKQPATSDPQPAPASDAYEELVRRFEKRRSVEALETPDAPEGAAFPEPAPGGEGIFRQPATRDPQPEPRHTGMGVEGGLGEAYEFDPIRWQQEQTGGEGERDVKAAINEIMAQQTEKMRIAATMGIKGPVEAQREVASGYYRNAVSVAEDLLPQSGQINGELDYKAFLQRYMSGGSGTRPYKGLTGEGAEMALGFDPAKYPEFAEAEAAGVSRAPGSRGRVQAALLQAVRAGVDDMADAMGLAGEAKRWALFNAVLASGQAAELIKQVSAPGSRHVTQETYQLPSLVAPLHKARGMIQGLMGAATSEVPQAEQLEESGTHIAHEGFVFGDVLIDNGKVYDLQDPVEMLGYRGEKALERIWHEGSELLLAVAVELPQSFARTGMDLLMWMDENPYLGESIIVKWFNELYQTDPETADTLAGALMGLPSLEERVAGKGEEIGALPHPGQVVAGFAEGFARFMIGMFIDPHNTAIENPGFTLFMARGVAKKGKMKAGAEVPVEGEGLIPTLTRTLAEIAKEDSAMLDAIMKDAVKWNPKLAKIINLESIAERAERAVGERLAAESGKAVEAAIKEGAKIINLESIAERAERAVGERLATESGKAVEAAIKEGAKKPQEIKPKIKGEMERAASAEALKKPTPKETLKPQEVKPEVEVPPEVKGTVKAIHEEIPEGVRTKAELERAGREPAPTAVEKVTKTWREKALEQEVTPDMPAGATRAAVKTDAALEKAYIKDPLLPVESFTASEIARLMEIAEREGSKISRKVPNAASLLEEGLQEARVRAAGESVKMSPARYEEMSEALREKPWALKDYSFEELSALKKRVEKSFKKTPEKWEGGELETLEGALESGLARAKHDAIAKDLPVITESYIKNYRKRPNALKREYLAVYDEMAREVRPGARERRMLDAEAREEVITSDVWGNVKERGIRMTGKEGPEVRRLVPKWLQRKGEKGLPPDDFTVSWADEFNIDIKDATVGNFLEWVKSMAEASKRKTRPLEGYINEEIGEMLHSPYRAGRSLNFKAMEGAMEALKIERTPGTTLTAAVRDKVKSAEIKGCRRIFKMEKAADVHVINEIVWRADQLDKLGAPEFRKRVGDLLGRETAKQAVEFIQPILKRARTAVKKSRPGEAGGVQAFAGKAEMPSRLEGAGEPISAHAIVRQAEIDFKVPVRYGRIGRRKASGTYIKHPEVIRMRRGREADLGVLSHEIAHHLDNVYKITKPLPAKLKAELKTLDYDYPRKMRVEEGFAEYMRHFLTDDLAESVAPKFHKHFKSWMIKNLQEAGKLKNLKGMIAEWNQQGAGAKIQSMISKTGKPERPAGETKLSWMGRKIKRVVNLVYRDIKDVHHFINVFEKKVIKKGWKGEKGEGPYQITKSFSQVGPSFTVRAIEKGPFTVTENVKTLGPGLPGVFKEIKSMKDYHGWREWAYARHSIESWKYNKDPGISLADAKYWYEKHYNARWENIARKFTEYHNALIDVQVDVGLITKEGGKAIKRYETYIPLIRVIDKLLPGHVGKKGLVNLGNLNRRRKGSDLQILDPMESTIQMTGEVYEQVIKQRVMNQIYEISRKTEGLGEWIVEVPPEMQATMFSFKEIKAQLENIGVDFDTMVNVEAAVRKASLERVAGDMLTVYRPDYWYKGGKPIARIIVKGEPKLIEFDKTFFKAITAMDYFQLPYFLDITMGRAANIMRLGATSLSTKFTAGNLVRDFQTQVVQSVETGVERFVPPVSHAARFVMSRYQEVVGKPGDPVVEIYRDFGGELSHWVGLDRGKMRRKVKDIMLDSTKRRAFGVVRNPVELARGASDVIEVAPRIREFEGALKRLGFDKSRLGEMRPKGELPPMRVIVEALNAAADVTVNFKRQGRLVRPVNRIFPFTNAPIESFDKMMRMYKDHPKQAAIGTASIMAVSALYWWNSHNDDWYKTQPDWQKYGFWTFPDADGKPILRLPRTYEWSRIFAGATEAALDTLYDKQPGVIEAYFKDTAKSLMPSMQPALITPIMESYFNYDLWRERPIVDYWLAKEVPEQQYYRYTTLFMRRAGELLGTSPAKLEHIAQGLTGGMYGRIGRGVEGAASGFEDYTLSDVPWIGKFALYKDYSRDVEDFYRERDRVRAVVTSARRARKRVPREAAIKYRRFEAISKMMAKYRTRARAYTQRDEAFRWQRHVIGLARYALERPALKRYPARPGN